MRPNPPANDGQERIAPAFRAERDFETGAAFLRELTEGTTVSVQRLDGAQFTLTLTGGLLKTSLPASTLSADGSTVTSPLGYKLAFTLSQAGDMTWRTFAPAALVGLRAVLDALIATIA